MTDRSRELAVTLLCGVVCILLALIYGPMTFFPRCYQSEWLPLFVAFPLLVVMATWIRFASWKNFIFGMLITAPPCRRSVVLVTESYLSPDAATVTAGDYASP